MEKHFRKKKNKSKSRAQEKELFNRLYNDTRAKKKKIFESFDTPRLNGYKSIFET